MKGFSRPIQEHRSFVSPVLLLSATDNEASSAIFRRQGPKPHRAIAPQPSGPSDGSAAGEAPDQGQSTSIFAFDAQRAIKPAKSGAD
jgi:hypothetical protein